MNKDLTGQVNRLKVPIFLLTTNFLTCEIHRIFHQVSWWLMKQKSALTVSTVSLFLKLNFLELTYNLRKFVLIRG